MSKLIQLNNKSGEDVFPFTTPSAILNEDGTSLDGMLNQFNQEQKQNFDNFKSEVDTKIANKQNVSDAVGKKTVEGGEVFNSSTIAGYNAHAEGNNTEANGVYSHAEGERSRAKGNVSHAEGSYTKAIGKVAHTEGYNTTSLGESSHSEGFSSNKASDGILESSGKEITDQSLTNNEIITAWNKKKFSLAKGDETHCEGRDNLAFGLNSHAEGRNGIAMSLDSHSEGSYCQARGQAGHAEGNGSHTYSDFSHAEGDKTTALGKASHSEGSSTNQAYIAIKESSGKEITDPTLTDEEVITAWKAKKFSLAAGKTSHVEGQDNLSLHTNCHLEGTENIAKTFSVHMEGSSNIAENKGQYSHIRGYKNTSMHAVQSVGGTGCVCDGYAAFAHGWYLSTYNTLSVAFGQWNKPEIWDANNWHHSQQVFSIGNGSSEADRSNAFTVSGSGNVRAAGTYDTIGADYAEMFEWADGNAQSEDRIGMIVAIEGEKIKKANNRDSIIGIIAAYPSVIGDSPMDWHNKYLNDKWGRPIYEDVEVEYTETEYREVEKEETYIDYDEEGNPIEKTRIVIVEEPYEVTKTRTDHVRKLNPEWNPKEPYVDRKDRKEWDAVGLMGKLLVRQDGTLKVGGRCTAKDGIATDSTEGFYVMKVIDSEQALILVK